MKRTNIKAALVFLISVLVLTGCNKSDHAAANQNLQPDLKGTIKTVRTEIAQFSNLSGQSVEEPRGIAEIKTYDFQRRETEESRLTPSGEMMTRTISKYDGGGKLVEQVVDDGKGNEIERKVFVYDKSGYITQWTRQKNAGALHSRCEFNYDESGNLYGHTIYSSRGAMTDRWSYLRDGQGRKSEETRYYADGSIDARYVYRFDDQGNQVEMLQYDSKGEASRKERYEYEFDSAGNWTKRFTEQWTAGKASTEFEPKSITYRTITYY